MSKPSIGDAAIPVLDAGEKKMIKNLTVLAPDSSETIFNLIFSETNNNESNVNNE